MFNIKISNEEKFLINILFKEKEKFDADIDMQKLDYDLLVKIASAQLMLPSLYVNLTKKGIIDLIPKELKKYLKQIYSINKKRNINLKKEINFISKIFKKNNINHVFLKGAANIICNIYNDISERMIGDIDILVKDIQGEKALRILKKYKYKPIEKDFFQNEDKHFIRHFNENKIFAIEIHKKLLSKKNSEKFNIDKFLSNKIMINNIYIPDIMDQLAHNIYNYQINDNGNINLSYSYRSLYDSYRLSRKVSKNKTKINADNYINNYFMILEELNIPLNNLYKTKKMRMNNYRFKLKQSNKLYKKIDSFVVNEIIQLNYRPKQVIKLITDENYRKYILEKLKK